MTRLLRLLILAIVWFLGISVFLVIVYRFVPVPVTATMLMDDNGITKDWTRLSRIDRNMVAAAIAVAMEFVVGIALVLGVYTRPFAFLMALYTLATAFIGHHYWTMADAARADNMIHFYKNVSIVGGLLLLCVTGAGKYSIDKR